MQSDIEKEKDGEKRAIADKLAAERGKAFYLWMRRKRLIRMAVHIAGWILLFSLLLGFVSLSQREAGSVLQLLPPSALLYFAGCIGLYYLNTMVLLPQLYMRGRYFAYGAVFLIMLALVYVIRPLDVLILDYLMPHHGLSPRGAGPMPMPPGGRPPLRPRVDIISLTLLIILWTLGFGLRIQRLWRHTEQRAVQAEADKANAELSFIKAQINPHFLFNTLNNIYSMAVTGSKHTAPSIMKLSQIMRYLTEQAEKDEVPLQEAVDCMTDFIDLHRLRFGPKVFIDYEVKGRLQGRSVIPLVFITFIENMFKYGVSSHEASPIKIELEAGDAVVRFFCENKILRQPHAGESTGIGINNARKQLAFAYPGKHELQINSADNYFRVLLLLHI